MNVSPGSELKLPGLFLIGMLLASTRRLPTVLASLIHADVYKDSLFWAKDELLLFDFDNCEYGHYIFDIAIALYAALWRDLDQPNPAQFSEKNLARFIAWLPGTTSPFANGNRGIAALPAAS